MDSQGYQRSFPPCALLANSEFAAQCMGGDGVASVNGMNRRFLSGGPVNPDNTEAAQFSDLIRRVRVGEAEAAAELVRRYEAAIRRVVRVHLHDSRLRRVLDSMDVCQSVLATFFVRANLGQYQLDTPADLLKLLTTIARHKVINQTHKHRADRRDFRREEPLGSREVLLGAGGADPSQVVADRELLEKVRERLSDDELRLAERRGRGDSWAAIAADQGGTAESLRKKLTRALDRVLRQLGLHEDGDE
jgi:DNA-directed RNA polymerase specialized sigma24 family protein